MGYISRIEDRIIGKERGFLEDVYSKINPFYADRRANERIEILNSLRDENGNLGGAGTFRDIEARLGFTQLRFTNSY